MTINKLDGIIQNIVPQVYDDSLSYYELLTKILNKLDEVIDDTNAFMDTDLQQYVADQLSTWKDDGTLETIINQNVLTDITDRLDTYDKVIRRVASVGPNSGYQVAADGNSDIAPVIQQAHDDLIAQGGGKLVIEPGSFLSNQSVDIDSNIEIEMDQATYIKKGFIGPIFRTKDTGASGYNGPQNIHIHGGVIDNDGIHITGTSDCIRFDHAFNVSANGITILNVSGGHGIEFNACNVCEAINNRFLGYIDPGGRSHSGAIQLDSALPGSSSSSILDGESTRNVIIQNNFFGTSPDSGYAAWCRGIGMHRTSNGKPYENIVVSDNLVETLTDVFISFLNTNNVLIKDNVMRGGEGINILQPALTDFSGGVYDEGTQTTTNSGSFPSNHNITIEGNQYYGNLTTDYFIRFDSETTGGTGGFNYVNVSNNECNGNPGQNMIFLNNVQYKPASSYFIRHGRFIGNSSNSTGDAGLKLNNIIDSVVMGNTIENAGNNGLVIRGPYCSDVVVANNNIKNVQHHGIFSGDGAKNINMYGNSIYGANQSNNFGSGIRVSGGGDRYLIGGNMILNGPTSQIWGIYVDTNTNVQVATGTNFIDAGSSGTISVA